MSVSTYTYRTEPIHLFPDLPIESGHAGLAQQILARLPDNGASILISIDGFVGLQWTTFIEHLHASLEQLGVQAHWLTTEACLLSEEQLKQKLESYLTGDPVFGRLYHGTLAELWDEQAV